MFNLEIFITLNEPQTSLLYFRGQRIWQAIILDLLPKGLGQAKKVLNNINFIVLVLFSRHKTPLYIMAGFVIWLLCRGLGHLSALWWLDYVFARRCKRKMSKRCRVLSWCVSFLIICICSILYDLILRYCAVKSCRRDVAMNHSMRYFYNGVVSLQVLWLCVLILTVSG